MTSKNDPLNLLKQNYLNRYNIHRSKETALNSGCIAALQRNPTYTNNLSPSKKERVREEWKRLLESIGKKYNKPQTIKQFKKDISTLKQRMNNTFPDSFNNGEYDNEFRLSHAQKSLSVYLKHLWCMGEIPEPPTCPIDRVVLTRAGLHGKAASWGYINDMDIYEDKLKTVSVKAEESGLSVARWELLNF